MAKVSSKGQITLPARWMKIMGGVATGEWLFFHINHADQIVYITKDGGRYDSCAQLLSQNFLTIPKEVRKWLKIQPSDDLEFGYDATRKVVYFKKRQVLLSCPVCKELGSIGEHPCFVCQETGSVEKEPWVNEITRLMIKSRSYYVSLSIIGHEVVQENKAPVQLLVPKIQLVSSTYSTAILETIQDYYQGRVIREAIEDGSLNVEEYKTEIMMMLCTDLEKDSLEAWLIANAPYVIAGKL